MGLLDWLRRKFGMGGPAPKQIEGEVDPRLVKTPEELCRDLDAAEAQAKENAAKMDELKRAYAGLINDKQSFQKRLQKEKERAIAEGSVKVVRELLEVSDDIDRALEASKEDTGPLAEGIRKIHESIGGRLTKLGMERMELVGKLFNPTMAEALEVVPVEGAEQDEVILGVFQAGYLLNGQVVREAKVRVGRYIPPPAPEPEPQPESAPESGAAPEEPAAAEEEKTKTEAAAAADAPAAETADGGGEEAGTAEEAKAAAPADGAQAAEAPPAEAGAAPEASSVSPAPGETPAAAE